MDAARVWLESALPGWWDRQSTVPVLPLGGVIAFGFNAFLADFL
jgi:hypothetical protein